MEFESEVFFVCPYCAQQISMLVEELYGSQSYIEDCEICCNSIEIIYQIEGQRVVRIEAQRA